jgi:hypothetical protein
VSLFTAGRGKRIELPTAVDGQYGHKAWRPAGKIAKLAGLLLKILIWIGFVFDDALPSLRREPVPDLSHILQLFFILRVFGFSRDLTTRSGVLFVFQNFLHAVPNTPWIAKD